MYRSFSGISPQSSTKNSIHMDVSSVSKHTIEVLAGRVARYRWP